MATPSVEQRKEHAGFVASSYSSASRPKKSTKSQHLIRDGDDDEEAIETSSKPDFSDPMALIGRKLRVYWPLDDSWYSGCVKAYEDPPFHCILYDDGEEEAICLQKEKIEWLPSTVKKVETRRKLRRLSFIKKAFVTEEEMESASHSESEGQCPGRKRGRKTTEQSNGTDKNICNENDKMKDRNIINDKKLENAELYNDDKMEDVKLCHDDKAEDTDMHKDKIKDKKLCNEKLKVIKDKNDSVSSDSGDDDDGDVEWIAKNETSSEEDEEEPENLDLDDVVPRATKGSKKIKKHGLSSKTIKKSSPQQRIPCSKAQSSIKTLNHRGNTSTTVVKTVIEPLVPKRNLYDSIVTEPVDKMNEQRKESCSGIQFNCISFDILL